MNDELYNENERQDKEIPDEKENESIDDLQKNANEEPQDESEPASEHDTTLGFEVVSESEAAAGTGSTTGGQNPSSPPPLYAGAINMTVKKRRMPTWAIVLVCVVAAVYLIISITLAIGVVTYSTMHIDDIRGHISSGDTTDDDALLEEHLQINDSPISEGAPTSEGALTVKEISQKVRASVVGVICQGSSTFSSSAVGSGIIMSEDGYIITNNHVIEGMTTIRIVLDDGTEYDARLIGADSHSDLAVVKVNATGLAAAEFGDSDKLEQGDPAIAIGNPAGLELQNSVTYGIISAINRDIVVQDRTMTLIQTDASINPGNSGGPLVNEFGQVIGINTVKVGISYYEGLGFAIPINTAKPIVDELISRGYIKGRPSIGISGTTITEGDSAFFNLPTGLYIDYVHPNSDAFNKGIRRGDVITKMNGTRLSSTAEIKKIRDNFTAGDTVTLTIYRNSEEVDIDVVLMDEAELTTNTDTAS